MGRPLGCPQERSPGQRSLPALGPGLVAAAEEGGGSKSTCSGLPSIPREALRCFTESSSSDSKEGSEPWPGSEWQTL